MRPRSWFPLLLLWTCTGAAAPKPAPAAPPAPPVRHATLPSASPDGRWIAYCVQTGERDSEIELVEVATGRTRRLTSGGGDKHLPAWLERGARVSWCSNAGDSVSLWSVDTSGTGPRLESRQRAKALALSHDGRWLVCTIGSWTRNRMWLVNRDGTVARALTDSTASWFNHAWSPGDRTIATTRMDSTGALEIWLVPVADGVPRSLVRLPEAQGRPQWPAWSPDGRRLAFQAGIFDREHPERNEAWVCVADLTTGNVTKLRQHPTPFLDETPSWVDGDHLAFQSSQTGRLEVWVMGADGMGARRLTK